MGLAWTAGHEKRRMIPATSTRCQSSAATDWQRELAQAISSPRELIEALGLPATLLGAAERASASFRVRVPRGYLARMRHGDASDPLLRQVLPLGEELESVPGFAPDPLDEASALAAPGLLHKYHGRALLITTGACAIHCRYCFRREFPYAEHSGAQHWRTALAHVAADATLSELILSGGDPLTLSDARLTALTRALAPIRHLRRLRVHTRLPIVLPSRVSSGLIEWLGTLPWPVVLVLHANHANEIDASVQAACERLRAAGVTLLNQTVLLRGVNDDPAVLAALSERLLGAGVLPYYLHLLDRVRGTAHFAVDEARAQAIAGELAARLPGYLVPRLVREQPHAVAKVQLLPHLPAPDSPAM
jgi:L-lysine 2,3-aminomutase